MKVERSDVGYKVPFSSLENGDLFSCDDGSGLYIKVNDDSEKEYDNAFAVNEDMLVDFEQDEDVIPRQGKIVVESQFTVH